VAKSTALEAPLGVFFGLVRVSWVRDVIGMDKPFHCAAAGVSLDGCDVGGLECVAWMDSAMDN
jgi:hypothetical protein